MTTRFAVTSHSILSRLHNVMRKKAYPMAKRQLQTGACRVIRFTGRFTSLHFPQALRLLAAKPMARPQAGWHLGGEESARGWQTGLRTGLWSSVQAPFAVPWLGGLSIYLYPGNEICREIFVTGLYEPSELHLLNNMLRPGMVVIDAGANMGLYTLFTSRRVGQRGVVVALEPSAREFDRLRANVQLNRLTNVRLKQVAVANCRMDAELLIAPEEHAGHNTLGEFAYPDVSLAGVERVEVTTVDEIVQQAALPTVDLVKMDIEGAELRALEGALQIIKTYRPALLLELSDRTLSSQGGSGAEVRHFLSAHNYRIFRFSPASGVTKSGDSESWFDSENVLALHESTRDQWPVGTPLEELRERTPA